MRTRNRTITIYSTNDTPLKYMKQNPIKLKGKVDSSIIIAGDFNTPPSIMERTARHGRR